MQANLLSVIKALASLKREATLKEVADLTSLTKGQVKNAVKGSPLVKSVEVPYKEAYLVQYLSLTDKGVLFWSRFNTQRKRFR